MTAAEPRNTDAVVSVSHLSKRYVVGAGGGPGQSTLRDAIAQRAGNLRRLLTGRGAAGAAKTGQSEFWALQDVSFDVKRGEVLGVIGRNGAGKSTLLKILSRITEPTRGRVKVNGRVASLLEVGTGFHAELTGRENIFLNGAILGMSRAEITAKFDEIVAFAEVDRFLDTPVKRYSSGMYVKLAFAVAAHLEPEILIIDEVLAVGDVVFQKKCLGKIHDVADSGRTVLFVSHNLSAISSLTERAILLENGRLALVGPSREVVSSYLQRTLTHTREAGDLAAFRRAHRTAGYADVCGVKICGEEPGLATLRYGDAIVLDVSVNVFRPVDGALMAFNILNEQMDVIATLMSTDAGCRFSLAPGTHSVRCTLAVPPLIPGNYRINVGVAQSSGVLAWDVLEGLPGFRLDGSDTPAWIESPDRAGSLLLTASQWQQVPEHELTRT